MRYARFGGPGVTTKRVRIAGLVAVLAALAGALVLPAQASAAPTWLTRLNAYRLSAGVAPVVESASADRAASVHTAYILETGQYGHYESRSSSYYSALGDHVARSSLLDAGVTTTETPAQAIDRWMAAPLHAMEALDPTLRVVGFSLRTDPSASHGYLQAAALYMPSFGWHPSHGTELFPGVNHTVPVMSFDGEIPNPLQVCAHYSVSAGLPVFATFGTGGTSSPRVYSASLTVGRTNLPLCVVTSQRFTGTRNEADVIASILGYYKAVVLVPAHPLVPGRYIARMSTSAGTRAWSFIVRPETARLTPHAPSTTALTAGQSTTVTGDVDMGDGAPVPDGTVDLVERSPRVADRVLATSAPDDHGQFALSGVPAYSGLLYVRYRGGSRAASVMVYAGRVTVAFVIGLSESSNSLSGTVTLTGQLTPARRVPVQLQQSDGNGGWQDVQSLTAASDGTVSVSVKQNLTTSQSFRLVVSGDVLNAAATSSPVTVSARL